MPSFAIIQKAIDMAGRYSLYREDRTGWTTFQNHEEFQEEDIWAVFIEKDDSNTGVGSFDSSTVTTKRLPAAARMIPRSNMISNQESHLIQQSAPVNIPDWSKVYGTKKPSRTVSFQGEDVVNGGYLGMTDNWYNDEEEEGDKLNGEITPPHEWIAKKLAGTQISSFSVCEGAGRTLKGRDLSRMRNTVLTRTGFLE